MGPRVNPQLTHSPSGAEVESSRLFANQNNKQTVAIVTESHKSEKVARRVFKGIKTPDGPRL